MMSLIVVFALLVSIMCGTFSGNDFIQPSLFSLLPPYIHFQPINKNVTLPYKIKKYLLWPAERKGSRKEIHDRAIEAAGLRLVRTNSTNLSNVLGWIRHPQSKKMKKRQLPTELQKVNVFPSIQEVTFKDRIHNHMKNIQSMFPGNRFPFLLPSFVLPQEIEEFRRTWYQKQNKLWIAKLPKTSNGRGVRVLKHWKDFHGTDVTVVQKYVHNPFLYDSRKLELRLTFIMTSVHPLRIYTFPDSLMIHLARSNYSAHEDYALDVCVYTYRDGDGGPHQCDRPEGFWDINAGDRGEDHKNVITFLDSTFGVDKIMYYMNEAIIFNIISVEKQLRDGFLKKAHSWYTYFQILSADFVLDETGKPWLLEMNSMPYRSTRNVWSAAQAENYFSQILNLVGFHFPNCLGQRAQDLIRNHLIENKDGASPVVFNYEFYNFHQTDEDIQKQLEYENRNERSSYVKKILEKLTAHEIRLLMMAEDELHRAKLGRRIFPTDSSFKYFRYIQPHAYYYKLFDAWEFKYGRNRTECRFILENLYRSLFIEHVDRNLN